MKNNDHIKLFSLGWIGFCIHIAFIPLVLTADFFYSDSDLDEERQKQSPGECISGNCENGYGIYAFEDGSKYTGRYIEGQPVREQGALWLHISDEFREGAESFYLRANSVEVGDNYLYAEDMSDLKEAVNPYNSISFTNYVEINCNDASSRSLHTKMYSRPLAQGQVTASSAELSLAFDFMAFSETERGALYEVLCEEAEEFKINPNVNSIVFKLPQPRINNSFDTSVSSS